MWVCQGVLRVLRFVLVYVSLSDFIYHVCCVCVCVCVCMCGCVCVFVFVFVCLCECVFYIVVFLFCTLWSYSVCNRDEKPQCV